MVAASSAARRGDRMSRVWRRSAPPYPDDEELMGWAALATHPVVSRRSALAMDRAQLVAVGIAQIGEIQRPGRALADARRILGRGAAVGDPGLVPGVGLLAVGHREADRAAV